jgi:glycine dehydrogenase subunit 1
MLDAVGADDLEALFDIPDPVRFDGELGIEPQSEEDVRREIKDRLGKNDDLVELLGRGHYAHYVPSMVDHLADRGEFITSYTQYQPEVQQGFLQALFEFQSLLVELTGLGVANCSMYDAATALGDAATMVTRLSSSRRHDLDGSTVLVPESLYDRRRSVLENYVDGAGIDVESYPTAGGTVDVDGLAEAVNEDTLAVYAESPAANGAIEEELAVVGDLAADVDAAFVVGTDPVALSVLRPPADLGADVVVGNAGVLGLPRSFGMGLGLFATREEYLRQVPGRLVGTGEDARERRGYTLTLQTREQHIRRERATSNICTNQAWVALRTAMHAFHLGPDGLVDLARASIEDVTHLAARVDDVDGFRAPTADRTYFREFPVETDRPAEAVASDLADRGFAVHVVDDNRLSVCVTGTTEAQRTRFVEAATEVAR